MATPESRICVGALSSRAGMRDAKRKAQAKGQVSTKPDEEKLARNEEKLVEAEAAYNCEAGVGVVRPSSPGRTLFLPPAPASACQ